MEVMGVMEVMIVTNVTGVTNPNPKSNHPASRIPHPLTTNH
jgi:hypothetical protein